MEAGLEVMRSGQGRCLFTLYLGLARVILGIAGDCYAAEDCYVWMPWPFVSELSASAVFGSPEMMACVLISFAECLCCLGLRQYNSFTHLEAKCFLTIRYIWLR